MLNKSNAKCEQCGTVFTLGVNGITTDEDKDICDQCANVTRNSSCQIVDETWFSMTDEELIERLR